MVKPFFSSRVMGWVCVCLTVLAVSCTKKDQGSSRDSATSKSGKSMSKPDERILNLAIWSHYISPELIEEFNKRTGIRVQVSNYSSNEELLAKLQAGASGYDVAVPSDYMVFVMIQLGLLKPLDFSKLPYVKNLDPKFMKKNFDPQNKYSVPFVWGTTGIAINRNIYKGTIKSWKDLFEKEDLAGKVSLLDDAREAVGAALKAQGYSLNTKNPAELQKAKELLLKMRKKVKVFTSEPMMPLLSGETPVAHIFMSDALQARKTTGGKVDYILPEEGGTLWLDSLVIPSGAKHTEEAYAFINFMLEPQSNLATVTRLFMAPANKGAYELLSPEMKSNTMLFPPVSLLSKCEMLEDLGESIASWDRIWTEVKAQQD